MDSAELQIFFSWKYSAIVRIDLKFQGDTFECNNILIVPYNFSLYKCKHLS